MNAIEAHGLAKSYRNVAALSGLDLTVTDGELFSLLGVNGAGKTTAIKLLSGLLRPTSGAALIYGNNIDTEAQQAKQLIAASPQETAVAPNLTVRENLELIAGVYGAGKAAARQRADEIMADLHLKEVSGKRAKKLSGGWQRRLSIAMALISKPRLLFLDEPTLGLDVLARRELWTYIQKLKGSVTVVLTTHYLEEAEALSDRIGILSGGKLTALGTAEALMAQTGTARFEDAFIALAGGKTE